MPLATGGASSSPRGAAHPVGANGHFPVDAGSLRVSEARRTVSAALLAPAVAGGMLHATPPAPRSRFAAPRGTRRSMFDRRRAIVRPPNRSTWTLNRLPRAQYLRRDAGEPSAAVVHRVRGAGPCIAIASFASDRGSWSPPQARARAPRLPAPRHPARETSTAAASSTAPISRSCSARGERARRRDPARRT